MMLPNQINNQRFSTVGKGGYKAIEVDAFIQKVFQNYNKLFNENNSLKERLSAITPLIDEYNENKKSIADALIWAKTTSDKSVEQAKKEAEEIIGKANAEGEKLIAEKAAEAAAVYSQELNSTRTALEDAKTELEMTRNQAKSFSERYISEINSKARTIIDDANTNASKIVADAYKDAQTARDKAEAIIKTANDEILAIKAEAAKLKAEIERAVKIAVESVSDFSVYEFEPETVAVADKIEAMQIDFSEIEEFTLDLTAEEAAEEKSVDFSESPAVYEEQRSDEPLISEDIGVGEVTVEDEIIISEEDFISGGVSSSMPDVNAYISKIFDKAGSSDSDFSSFADGLNEVFASSAEDGDISFYDLKKSIEGINEDKETSDDE